MAKLIFDDRTYSINKINAETITNFFSRSPTGLSFDNILKTPLFGISQSQNIGLQLADVVTYIIGLTFAGFEDARPFWKELKKAIYSWRKSDGKLQSSLKVLRGT